MATLKEYFYKDFQHTLRFTSESTLIVNNKTINFIYKCQMDFLSGTEFGSIYLGKNLDDLNDIAAFINTFYDQVTNKNIGIKFQNPDFILPDTKYYLASGFHFTKNPGFLPTVKYTTPDNPSCGFADLIHTWVLYLYINKKFSANDHQHISKLLNYKEILLRLKGENYKLLREKCDIPLAFISHDSRDKDNIARFLAIKLYNENCSVWYDEFSLAVGSNLRENIEDGIKKCKKCILIISKNFLTNTSWAKEEFENIHTKSLHEKSDILIPIWYGVSKKEVYEYSTWLASKVAIIWPNDNNEQEIEKIIKKIIKELNK
jgi:hypothetical protein